MSIKPIDLQTVFAKMNDVGKEQAHLKGAVESQQAREAQKMIDQEIKQDHAVNSSDENRETNPTDDQGTPGEYTEQELHEREKEQDEEKEKKKSVVTDPDIGRHIDISG